MANYRRYQGYKPKRSLASRFSLGKALLIVGIIIVVYLIGRALFSPAPSLESNVPEPSNTNVAPSEEMIDENSNNAANSNQNSNASTNTASNTNSVAEQSVAFSAEDCEATVSSGDGSSKQISLTFNVGTTKEGDVQKVLEALTSTDTPADFFARGDVAEENPDLIKTIAEAGFSIYNLSYDHPRFTDLTAGAMEEQLEQADGAISAQTGKSTKPFFRPPYGASDETVVATVTEAGYCPITWTVDALDWSSDYSASDSKERVISSLRNGAIVLMQASNAITAEIVPQVITEAEGQGYSIVPLDTLLQ